MRLTTQQLEPPAQTGPSSPVFAVPAPPALNKHANKTRALGTSHTAHNLPVTRDMLVTPEVTRDTFVIPQVTRDMLVTPQVTHDKPVTPQVVGLPFTSTVFRPALVARHSKRLSRPFTNFAESVRELPPDMSIIRAPEPRTSVELPTSGDASPQLRLSSHKFGLQLRQDLAQDILSVENDHRNVFKDITNIHNNNKTTLDDTKFNETVVYPREFDNDDETVLFNDSKYNNTTIKEPFHYGTASGKVDTKPLRDDLFEFDPSLLSFVPVSTNSVPRPSALRRSTRVCALEAIRRNQTILAARTPEYERKVKSMRTKKGTGSGNCTINATLVTASPGVVREHKLEVTSTGARTITKYYLLK